MKFSLIVFIFLLSISILPSTIFTYIPHVPIYPQNDCDPNELSNVLNDRKPSSLIGCSNGKPGGKSPPFSGENDGSDQRPNNVPAPKQSGYKPNDERLINAIQLFQNVNPIFINGFGNNPPPPCSANCFALKDMDEQKACIKRCAACWDEKQCDQCGDDKQCREKCYEEQIFCDYVLPNDGHGGIYLQCRWHMKTQSPPLCVEYKYTPSGKCLAQTDFKDNIYRLNGVDLPGVYKCGNCTADVAGNIFCNFIVPTKLPGYNLSCVYRKLYAENGQHDYEFLCATMSFIEVDQQLEQ